ncbi:MAG: hypothetical protein GZ091_17900 [Paludibacter sp.]|nr:hypothetical protein [Paludibacter sp.]
MKDKTINKIQITSYIVLLISWFATTNFNAAEKNKLKELVKHNIVINHPARASPADTSQYSIQIDGKSNTVIINDTIMVTSRDTTVKRNNIRVKGEGNTITVLQNDKTNSVSVIQNDSNSKVSVSQSGNNNTIKISQNNK